MIPKRCSKCREDKNQDTDFHRQKSTLTGYHAWCKECLGAWEAEWQARRREMVVAAYGGKCTVESCSITNPNMLVIDHVNDDGAEHRKTVQSGTPIIRWLIKHKFPEGFQLLCPNHNWEKEFNRRKQRKLIN